MAGRVIRLPTYSPNRVAAPGGVVNQIATPTQGMQAVGQLAAKVNQWALQQADENDETTVKDLLNQAEAEARRVYYGGDGQQGIATLQGEAALKAIPKTREALAEIANRYGGAAGNARQRGMFAQAWSARSASYDENLLRTEAVETERNKDAVQLATIGAHFEEAAVNPDPKVAAARIKAGEIEADSYLQRKGVPVEARPAEIKKMMSEGHQRIVAGLIARNDPTAALKHIETYSDQIDDTWEATIRPRLKEARTHDVAYARALLAVKTGEDPLEVVGKDFRDDPDGGQKFLQFHASFAARKASADAADKEAMRRQLSAKLFNGEDLTGVEEAAANAAGLGPDIVQWRKQAAEGRLPVEGDVAYWDVNRRLFEDPNFAGMTIPKLRDWALRNNVTMHPNDWEKIEARLDGNRDKAQAAVLPAINNVTSTAMKLISVYQPGMTPKDSQAIEGQVMKFVADEVWIATAGGTKELTPADMRRIAELAASRGGTKDTPLAADPAALTEYREDPVRWGGLLNRLSTVRLEAGRPVAGETDRANRKEMLSVIARVEAGKPAYRVKDIPKFFTTALAQDFLPLTPDEQERAYSEWLMTGRIESLPQSRRKGYASPGHATPPRR